MMFTGERDRILDAINVLHKKHDVNQITVSFGGVPVVVDKTRAKEDGEWSIEGVNGQRCYYHVAANIERGLTQKENAIDQQKRQIAQLEEHIEKNQSALDSGFEFGAQLRDALVEQARIRVEVQKQSAMEGDPNLEGFHENFLLDASNFNDVLPEYAQIRGDLLTIVSQDDDDDDSDLDEVVAGLDADDDDECGSRMGAF